MNLIYLLFFFCFSLIIGSFLNVVIYRYNTGLSVAKGRSKCFSCGNTLTAKDLIPVFSYIRYKGRCRSCHSSISIQYPLVELLTATLLTLIFYKYFISTSSGSFIGTYVVNTLAVSQVLFSQPWLQYVFFIVDIVIACLAICIGVYDMRHKIIPDRLVYTGALIAFAKLVLVIAFFGSFTDSWLTLLSGLFIALPFALLWLVSGGRWMGLGDAKLALIIGWMLGIVHGITAFVYSFWIGAIAAISMMLIHELVEGFSNKKNSLGLRFFGPKISARLLKMFPPLKMRAEIPFGPFMIIALYVVYFTGYKFFGL